MNADKDANILLTQVNKPRLHWDTFGKVNYLFATEEIGNKDKTVIIVWKDTEKTI